MKKILFVDDEPEILELFELLEDEGFKIFTAPNPHEALKLLDQEIIHLVISDIKMPGMDGIEFMQKTLERLKTAPPKFVLFSGSVALDEQKLLDQGATAVLRKPEGLVDLPDSIRKILG